MFSHRFKIEIRENRIYAIIWFLVLAILTISAISYWNSEIKFDPLTGRPGNSMSEIIGLLIIPLGAIPIVCTVATFRQDNLKDPRAFWNTRPVRPAILHTTKIVFLHLLFTLPLALCTFLVSINATDFGTSMIYAGEAALWSAAAIHLAALASLHNHQISKLLLIPAVGLLGIMFTAYLVSQFHLTTPNSYHPTRFNSNLLITTCILLVLFVLGGIALIKKPTLKFPLWAPLLVGSLTFPVLSASWLPRFNPNRDVVEFHPSEPLTEFTTATTRHNLQHYYLLNYPLENLLPGSDRIPIKLLSHQLDYSSLSELNSGFKTEIKSWNGASDHFPGDKNLERIALDQNNDRLFNITLSVGVPHDHSIRSIVDMDDLPRKNVTIEGDMDIITLSPEDAFTIDRNQTFTSKEPGQSFTYKPSGGKNIRSSIMSKTFSLPLASSVNLQIDRNYHGQNPFISLKHRETGQFFLLQENSGRTFHSMFGRVHYSEIQNPREDSMVNHYWKHRLQNKFPDFPDFEEWNKNTELQILPPERFKTVTVPFKVTVALPDLDLLQKRLNDLPE